MTTMPTGRAAWRRLAQAVVDERAAFGWTQADVADRGQFSIDRVQELEKGERTSYRPTTLGALERGLYWQPGSVRRVLAGESPERIEKTEPGQYRQTPLDPIFSDESRSVVASVIESIRHDADLLEEAKEHLLNQYRLLLRLSLPESGPAVDPQHGSRPGDLPPPGPEGESIEQRRERLRLEHTARAQRTGRHATPDSGGIEEGPRRAAGGGGRDSGVGGRTGDVRS